MAEPKNPSLPRMREWPMFRGPRRHRAKSVLHDGRPLPRIADLVMERVPGTPAEKLAWLRGQMTAGRLDGDDLDEVAQAEALLSMLVRLSATSGRRAKRHLDDLLDEGLRQTFPASDPVTVGHFTSTEPPTRPLDRAVPDMTSEPKTRRRGPHTHGGRGA